MDPKVSLTIVPTSSVGQFVDAPPIIVASDHSVDYTCGSCGTVLLHAEEGQIYGLTIRCTQCGSYNSTNKT
jgi:DNA-directed RNA polymerase subunit RPC12/RpoP